MARVYVSGSIRDVERVRSVQAKLRWAGHNITHDWTLYEGAKLNPAEAERQLHAVWEAECLVLLVHPRLKAGWMEFGAAVSHRLPCIVVPHEEVGDSMWYTLPMVHLATPGGNIAEDVTALVGW